MGTKRASSLVLVGMKTFKGQSKEKCLLGRDEYGSNMHPACNKDLLQRVLVAGMSPASLEEGRKYRMSIEKLQLPH